jgi:hypothetical protein
MKIPAKQLFLNKKINYDNYYYAFSEWRKIYSKEY